MLATMVPFALFGGIGGEAQRRTVVPKFIVAWLNAQFGQMVLDDFDFFQNAPDF